MTTTPHPPTLAVQVDTTSADYSNGWTAGYRGAKFDATQSLEWRLGHSNGRATLLADEKWEAQES